MSNNKNRTNKSELKKYMDVVIKNDGFNQLSDENQIRAIANALHMSSLAPLTRERGARGSLEKTSSRSNYNQITAFRTYLNHSVAIIKGNKSGVLVNPEAFTDETKTMTSMIWGALPYYRAIANAVNKMNGRVY